MKSNTLKNHEDGMPAKEIVLPATVVGALSPTSFRVELENGQKMLAGLSGNMRMGMIQLLPGTRVYVEFFPHDLSEGRIIKAEGWNI
jgi:translation initiation factor IF-1